VQLVLEAEKRRLPELLPLRHGRMVRSAFTFYRGAALTMASDLASTPFTGIRVQCCGDAHLCNFGGFATPERRIIFAINDLDETLPAPWEWDVKRLAASFVVACRDKGLSDAAAKDVVMSCVRTYRESMAEFSGLKTLELWYRALAADELIAGLDPDLRQRAMKRIQKEQAKSRGEEMFPKLVEHKGDMPIIKDQLPTIFHAKGHSPGEVQKVIRDAFNTYRDSLPHSSQSLLDRYELRDAAIKVVGVGSVGTACWVLLFMAGENDPLFLQVKEATYIEAARSYGAGSMRIIFRYMVPRIIPMLVPGLVTLIPAYVFLEASLAYLGLGDPSLPTWGKVINDAAQQGALYNGQYYWVLEPAALLMVTGLGFALVGFALDRIFNPRLRGM